MSCFNENSPSMCRSKKYPYPPPQRVIGNFKGEGVLKAKVSEGTYEPKLEFLEEWRLQTKKPLCGGSMDIFWNKTIIFRAVKASRCYLFSVSF